MNLHNSASEKGAFTLMELLVVVAIIGILMALLFPAVNGVLNAAKKAQARNDVTQIATACVAFETEYGFGPWGTNNPTEVEGEFLAALMGSNNRQIVFLEVQDIKDKRRNGFDGEAFVDPWGGRYQFAYDPNYSSSITTAGISRGESVRKNYAVWTDPSKQKWNTNSKPDGRYVQSW
ncbi:MAG: prepilin-type N-terminal cleavage/methylation domain-containing protein [Chthoniobacterales bacterium]|nr:prepilin-type N-terminal cleavage/methylation domain-containing protein [Chthoniobacterales bacterium]